MNYLTADFLASKGIVASKALKDWLTRASFIAKTRGNPTETERYARWALCVIEDHLATKSVDEVEWKSVPTVMTAKAEGREPKMLSRDAVVANAAQPDSADCRAALYQECMGRSPPELKRFLNQAFELYDKDVAKGKRHYKQVSFMEMLNIARNLDKKEQAEKAKAAALHRAYETLTPASAPAAAPDKGTLGEGGVEGAKTVVAVAPAEKRKRADEVVPHASRREAVLLERPYDRQAHNDNNTSSSSSSSKRAKHEPLLLSSSSTSNECAAFFQDLISKGGAGKEREYRIFRAKSNELERRYSRYEPTEEDIRPLHVLAKSFDFIITKSVEKERQENRPSALAYVSDQLKGMRQDLRVQNIVNDFTVMVYERHARICLVTGDIGEFNQCQASLKSFYEYRSVDKRKCHMAEFFIYRIVYLSLSKQYDSLSTELIEYTNTCSRAQCAAVEQFLPTPERMQKVLELVVALDNGDVISALQIISLFKKELQFLVQIYLPRMRVYWLYTILCGIRGKISLRFIMSNLGFLPGTHGDGAAGGASKDEVLLWMDGDRDLAQTKFNELFATLKIALPPGFNFEKELAVGNSTGISLDAGAALQHVQEYIQYLGTRNDAQI